MPDGAVVADGTAKRILFSPDEEKQFDAFIQKMPKPGLRHQWLDLLYVALTVLAIHGAIALLVRIAH
jgi:hypothetical protein